MLDTDDSHVTNTDCLLSKMVKAHEEFLIEELEETTSQSTLQALEIILTFTSNTLLVLPKCQKLF